MKPTGGRGAERYGLALILILASMVFVMAAPDERWAEFISMNLQALALIASLRAAEPGRKLKVACGVLIAAIIVAAWVEETLLSGNDNDFVHLATLALVLIAIPVIIWGLISQVKERGKVSTHTMMGVLCIYLLMSLAFASSFAAIDSLGDEPFFSQGEAWSSISNYLYYSLTTITTMGIGDLTPNSSLGRSLTAVEGLFGQIYLVTVVALIVGNLGRSRSDG